MLVRISISDIPPFRDFGGVREGFWWSVGWRSHIPAPNFCVGLFAMIPTLPEYLSRHVFLNWINIRRAGSSVHLWLLLFLSHGRQTCRRWFVDHGGFRHGTRDIEMQHTRRKPRRTGAPIQAFDTRGVRVPFVIQQSECQECNEYQIKALSFESVQKSKVLAKHYIERRHRLPPYEFV